MSIHDFLDENLTNLWLNLGVGVFFAGLVFFIGWLFFRKKHKPESITVRRTESRPSDAVLSNDLLFGMEMARRQSVRRKGQQIEVLIASDATHQDCECGTVLDRSLGGLRLLVSQPAKVGAILHVRTVDAPDELPWVAVEVKRCRQADNGTWEIGCQYVSQPADEVLQQFG